VALVTAIAYDVERNLGRAYNEIMSRLLPRDWCCFIDHDALWTTRDWYKQLSAAIAAHKDAGLIVAVTNRVGRKEQIAPGAPTGHDMREHFAFGARLRDEHGSTVRDITTGPLISGVVMCLSHETWEAMGGFADGFFGVDNAAHRAVRRIGKRIYLMPGLYTYHWYRADGVGHDAAPRALKS
jgi:GT2 family glycosyltransferase